MNIPRNNTSAQEVELQSPEHRINPCGRTTTECQRSGGCAGRVCDVRLQDPNFDPEYDPEYDD